MALMGTTKGKVAAAVVIAFFGFLFVGFVMLIVEGVKDQAFRDAKSAEQTRIAQQRAAADAQQKAAADEQHFNAMSSREHIDEAKKLLVADASPASVELAEKHLGATRRQDAREVSALRAKFKEAQVQADRKRQQIAAEEERKEHDEEQLTLDKVRIALAAQAQEQMLSQGVDAHISAVGPHHTILRVQWPLMNRVEIYQMIHDPTFSNELRAEGFTKVIATDGYEQSWTLSIE